VTEAARPVKPAPPPSAGHEPRQSHGPSAELGRGLLAIAGLSSLAIAQPVYDLLRRTPEFFAIRHLGVADLLALVALLAVGPPLALSVPAAAARFRRPAWIRPAVAGPVGLLTGAIALQAAHGLPAAAAVALGAVAVAGGAWAYVRLPAVRILAAVLAVAAAAAPAVLVLDRDVRRSLSIPDRQLPTNPTGAQAPVVLVVFDEWSMISILDGEGKIDRQRLPNLARLADRGTWYPNATSASNMTHHAVPALLTGLSPERERLPIAEDHPINLFTLLAPSHDLFVMEPVTSLCPPTLNRFEQRHRSFASRFGLLVSDLRFVWLSLTLPEPWAKRLPPLDRTWSGFGLSGSETALTPSERQLARSHPHRRNDERVADFRRFIGSLVPPGERPGVYFAHVLLPHGPWEYLPSGRRYGRSRSYGLRDGIWTADPWTVRNHEKRYLLQVQFVDRLIGELIDRLESLDLFDRSLIALTADHGASFQPGKSLRLPGPDASGDQLLDLVAVPLIVKAPLQDEAKVDEGVFSLVDLLPRILELAGARPGALAQRSPTGAEPLWFAEHVDGLRLPADRGPWRRARLAAQTELLGSANDPAAIGTEPDLHGRSVAELPLRDGSTHARLDVPDAWDDVDKDAMFVPAVVEATFVEPGDRTDRSVAVAVNGIVADSVRPYAGPRGRSRISALLPDDLLLPGRNRIDLFFVSGRDAAPGLERISPPEHVAYEADPDYSWAPERNSAGLVRGLLRRPAGSLGQAVERFRIVASSGELYGHLEATVPGQRTAADGRWTFRLSGRVFDAASSPGQSGTVVVMVGGNAPVAFTGPALRDSGFTLELKAGREQVEREGIVAFAVGHGGVATRLRFAYQAIERDRSGREVVPLSDGRRLVVTVPGGGYAGALDHVIAAGKSTRISAWAADLAQLEGPRQMVIYRDDRFLALLRAAKRDRLDIAERFSAPSLLRSGFNGTVPGGPLPSVFPQRHRVFAVMNRGAAVELSIPTASDGVR